jgi:hypothetical protein
LGGATLEVIRETKMKVRNDIPAHRAFFVEQKRPNGERYWEVFAEVVGCRHEDRQVLIGEIHIDEAGFKNPVLFVGAYGALHRDAERFFSSYIESSFIYQLASFMREIEKRINQTEFGPKLDESAWHRVQQDSDTSHRTGFFADGKKGKSQK